MALYDKLDLEIPFHPLAVREYNCDSETGRAGMVDQSRYDFKGLCEVNWVNGQPVFETPTAKKFESIESSISGIAVGFYPTGNGFNEWPHIRIKASPSKILQGHNVFGTENIREGCMQMIASARLAFPKIFQDLELEKAEVRFLDCTYSARIESRFYINRIFKLFRSMAGSRTLINNNHEDYLKLGRTEYNAQKIYLKFQEVIADLTKAKRKNQKKKIEVLSDKRLQDWALDLMRFEATIGHRRLDNLGIPRRLDSFLKWHDWYEETYGEPACRYLWSQNFKPFFKQLEGQTMIKVDDESVKLQIHLKFDRIKDNGKICKRKSNAIFKTFRQIKSEGYAQLASENNQTFFRNVNHLIECGFSRAFLKSLDPDKPSDNVVPIVQMINIDFSNQKPSWYVEPKSGFDDSARLILVA